MKHGTKEPTIDIVSIDVIRMNVIIDILETHPSVIVTGNVMISVLLHVILFPGMVVRVFQLPTDHGVLFRVLYSSVCFHVGHVL